MGDTSYVARRVSLTWEDVGMSYGDAQVTRSHLIWIPHQHVDCLFNLRIPLQSIVAVDRETRGLLKKKHTLKVSVRVDSNRNPTGDVLNSQGIRVMILQDTENLDGLYDCLNRLVFEASTSYPMVAAGTTPAAAGNSIEQKEVAMDPRIAQIMDLGYREPVIRAALESCEPGACANDVITWLLDNEASLKLQLDHDADIFKLGEGGIRGVFSREYTKLVENFDAVHRGLMNQENLNALTKELDTIAHGIFDRKRLNGESEDDIMEDTMYKSMLEHDLIGCIPEESVSRDVYIQELSRQIGYVLLVSSRSSYGVMSVSEGYRLFNRRRFQNVVSPRDFIDACRHFQRVSIPLVYDADSSAIFSQEPAMEHIRRQILSCVSTTHGVSRVHIATQTRIPVGIVKHYLHEAEKSQILARDEKSSRGLLYYQNMFHQFS